MLNKLTRLFAHEGFKKYFANTSWLFAEKILRMAVGLFVGVWVARYLGPEKYGLLSYAQSFVGLFSVIATLGIDSIVVRELIKHPKTEAELLGTAFGLKIIGAVLTFLLLAIAVSFTSNDKYTNTLVFIVAGAVVFQAFNVIDIYFQAKIMSKHVAFVNMFSLFVSSVIKVILILNQAPLEVFAWIVVLDSFILSCGLVYVYKKHRSATKRWVFRKKVGLALLKNSWPLILSGIVISVYMKIDQVMIKEMLGVKAVGNYAAAVKISEVWYFIPVVISASLFPAIINAKEIDESLYYKRLQSLYSLLVWIAMLIMLPMIMASDKIINFLYGVTYEEAGSILTIHIWACVFVFLGVASGKWLIAENLQVYAFIRTFVGVIVNIILNLKFIPRYGADGAAIATLVSQATAALLFDVFHNRTRPMFYMKVRALFFPWRYLYVK